MKSDIEMGNWNKTRNSSSVDQYTYTYTELDIGIIEEVRCRFLLKR